MPGGLQDSTPARQCLNVLFISSRACCQSVCVVRPHGFRFMLRRVGFADFVLSYDPSEAIPWLLITNLSCRCSQCSVWSVQLGGCCSLSRQRGLFRQLSVPVCVYSTAKKHDLGLASCLVSPLQWVWTVRCISRLSLTLLLTFFQVCWCLLWTGSYSC